MEFLKKLLGKSEKSVKWGKAVGTQSYRGFKTYPYNSDGAAEVAATLDPTTVETIREIVARNEGQVPLAEALKVVQLIQADGGSGVQFLVDNEFRNSLLKQLGIEHKWESIAAADAETTEYVREMGELRRRFKQ